MQKQITQDIVRNARNLGDVKSLLVVDDLLNNPDLDPEDAKQGCLEVLMLTKTACNDNSFRPHMRKWLNGVTGTNALRDLFHFSLGDGRTYFKHAEVAHRVDIIDSASLHCEEKLATYSRMEDIQKLAIEHGAGYSVIVEDEDFSVSREFCKNRRDFMSLADEDRFVLDERSFQIPEAEDDSPGM